MKRKRRKYWHKLWQDTDFMRRLTAAENSRTSRCLFDYVAKNHVHPAETIAISCGTTMACLGRAIFDRMARESFGALTVVTTNLEVLLEALSREGKLAGLDLFTPYGGANREIAALVPHKNGLVDIPKRAIDTMFMSFAGISPTKGFFDESRETWEAKQALLEALDDRHGVPGSRNVCVVLRGYRIGLEKGSLSYSLADFQRDCKKGGGTRGFLLAADVPGGEAAAEAFRGHLEALTNKSSGWGFREVYDQGGVVLLSTRP